MDERSATGKELSTPERDAHRLRNGIIWAAALLLLLLTIGLAVPDLRDVLERAAGADLVWLLVALGLEIASCLGYVATVRLVLRRGPRREVRALAWAEMAFGAVVPIGGAGGLAVGAWAMRAWKLPWRLIASRSAVIFLLTSAVNAAVLAIGGLALAAGIGAGTSSVIYGLIPAAAALAVLLFFLLLPYAVRRVGLQARRGRVALILTRTADWVLDTVAILRERNWRLLGSLAYLLCDIAVLWASLLAVGVHPPLLAIVVGYQIGYLANVLPVPGGVGVLEGGLLGALLLYGLPAAPTAAAVVIYHAIALWVPAIGGTLGFVRLRGAVAGAGATVAPLRAAAAQPLRAELDDIAA